MYFGFTSTLYAGVIIVIMLAPDLLAADGGGRRVRVGAFAAAGVGGFHGHRALHCEEFGEYAVNPRPAVSGSAGIAIDIVLNEVVSIAAEPQYSLYRAREEFVKREADALSGAETKTAHEAGASLHSAEVAMLARVRFGAVYIETGIQPGVNIHARIYKDGSSETPRVNRFTCGVNAGLGAAAGSFLFGARGYYGITEYDKKHNGYPWMIRGGITKFFIY